MEKAELLGPHGRSEISWGTTLGDWVSRMVILGIDFFLVQCSQDTDGEAGDLEMAYCAEFAFCFWCLDGKNLIGFAYIPRKSLHMHSYIRLNISKNI